MFPLMDVGWVARESNTSNYLTYESVEGARRVRFVPEALWFDSSQEVLDHITQSAFNPTLVVLLEGQGDTETREGGTGEILEIETANPNYVCINVESYRGGWLVLSDTWYPGWQVRVDGSKEEIHRANYLFRAVWVKPGEHLVEFRYFPLSVVVGALLSISTLLVLLGWAWISRAD
jgi:hypothetical protein